MKPWTAVRLINRSGLASDARAELLCDATGRLAVPIEKEHAVALSLPVRTLLGVAERLDLRLDFADIMQGKETPDASVLVAAGRSGRVTATLEDVFGVDRGTSAKMMPWHRVEVLQAFGLRISGQDDAVRFRIGLQSLAFFKPVMDWVPSLAHLHQIDHWHPEHFIETCRAFGIEPTFWNVTVASQNFGLMHQILGICLDSRVPVPDDAFTTKRWFLDPKDVAVYMWRTASPLLFYGDASLVHRDLEKNAELLRARRAVRTIQRLGKLVRRTRAARRIQRQWRRAVTDPTRVITRKRLRREFESFV